MWFVCGKKHESRIHSPVLNDSPLKREDYAITGTAIYSLGFCATMCKILLFNPDCSSFVRLQVN